MAGSTSSGLEEAAAKAQQEQPADLLDGGVADQQEVDESGQPIEKPTLAKGPVPDIVVASEPTELLVTDGAPTWTAIPENSKMLGGGSTASPWTCAGEERSSDTLSRLLVRRT